MLSRAAGSRDLTDGELHDYLLLLARGASPSVACQQLGVGEVDVAMALVADADFRDRHERVQALLSQNVAAALYRAAMEGSVSAQTFYLKNRPPPEWPAPTESPNPSSLDELTDDELFARLQQGAAALAAASAATDDATSGAGES